MNHYYKTLPALICAALLTACTEDTGTMGMLDDSDGISTSTATFMCYTTSIPLNPMRCSSDKCSLGQITDPETQSIITADFAAQFNTLEGALMPPAAQVVRDADGTFKCDGVSVRLFFQNCYGNDKTPLKINMYELSTKEDRMLREDSTYFTDVNLHNFIATKEELSEREGLSANVTWPISKIFTPRDCTESDSALNSSTHYHNIHIPLPVSYGKRILNLYRTHPQYFASSYDFIRHVCPGFYFSLTDGSGAMLSIDVAALDVYYSYYNNDGAVTQGVCRFSATGEVIQVTSFRGGSNSGLLNNQNCTYIKAPAGIGTVVKLPVDEIYYQHEHDSLSLAAISFTRYNAPNDQPLTLQPCEQIAMVERSEMEKFFERNYYRNPRSYAVTSLSAGYNIYQFNNIGRLVSYLHEKKQQQAALLCNGDTASYAQLHPEWNEVVLLPVTIGTNSDNQVVRISPDMNIASTRLVGGHDNPIQMQVIYSRYNK